MDPANQARPATPANDRPDETHDPHDVADPGNDPRRFGARSVDERPPRGRHQFGAGGGAMSWQTVDSASTLRLEVCYRAEILPHWRATVDGAFVASGEIGSYQGKDGFGLSGGVLREFPIGVPPRWYPHVRAALALESLSGPATSTRLLALRAGPGLGWQMVEHLSLVVDAEATVGVLWEEPEPRGGSSVDVAIGGVARFLIDM